MSIKYILTQRLNKVEILGGAMTLKGPKNAWFLHLGGAKSTKNLPSYWGVVNTWLNVRLEVSNFKVTLATSLVEASVTAKQNHSTGGYFHYDYLLMMLT